MPRPAPRFQRLTQEQRRTALAEAALTCIARGGIAAFTVDRVAAEAGVSGGLVMHHFGSKEGLLAAAYARIYGQMTEALERPHLGVPRIVHLVEVLTSTEFFNREALNIWVALWGAIANNPQLMAEHRARLAGYRLEVEMAINEHAAAAGREVDAPSAAIGLICLIDGLGVQHCIDPDTMPASIAREACYRYLESELGRLLSPT